MDTIKNSISFGDGEFQMMEIKVSILGLTGIVCEHAAAKKKGVSPLKRVSTSKKLPGVSGTPSAGTATSSLSTTDDETSSTHTDERHDAIPTTAVATFFRNVSNSQTAIATHVPSLPLGVPTSSFGSMDRYLASWPNSDSGILPQAGEPDQSTISFSRLFRREHPNGPDECTSAGVFVPERAEITLGLSHGREMLPLGKVELVVSGEEVGEVNFNLPVKNGKDALPALPLQRKKSKIFRKGEGSKNKNGIRMYSFKGDRTRKYGIDENATLRVVVQVMDPSPGRGAATEAKSVASAISGLTDGMTYTIETSANGDNKNSDTTRSETPTTYSTETMSMDFAEKLEQKALDFVNYKRNEDAVPPHARSAVSLDKRSGARSRKSQSEKLTPARNNKSPQSKNQPDDGPPVSAEKQQSGKSPQQTTPLPISSPTATFCMGLCGALPGSSLEVKDDADYVVESGAMDYTATGDGSRETFDNPYNARRRRQSGKPLRRRVPSYDDSLMDSCSDQEDYESYRTNSFDGYTDGDASSKSREIRRAREMIHRYANSMGVAPEELI